MYKNPLNDGKVSDYNSIKNQRNNAKRIKEYQSVKLDTEPTELQKYYQYLTYQQSILDELNYVAERMRTEDVKKKSDDFKFTERLKIERENKMKEISTKEEDKGMETLFDKSSLVKEKDKTPTIVTDIELETEPTIKKIDLIRSELFEEEEAPIKEDIFELSRRQEKKKNKKEAKIVEEDTAVATLQGAFRNKIARNKTIERGLEIVKNINPKIKNIEELNQVKSMAKEMFSEDKNKALSEAPTEQIKTAKQIAKEQQKAVIKAEKQAAREQIKAEKKAAREQQKAEIKAEKQAAKKSKKSKK